MNVAIHAVYFKASVSFNVSVLAYCACTLQRNMESLKGTEALATGDLWGHSDPAWVHTATSHCKTLLDHTATASLKAPPPANNTFGISNKSLISFITVSGVLLVQQTLCISTKLLKQSDHWLIPSRKKKKREKGKKKKEKKTTPPLYERYREIKPNIKKGSPTFPPRKTWYHTEVPPKSIWKSVKHPFTLIKQYLQAEWRTKMNQSETVFFTS